MSYIDGFVAPCPKDAKQRFTDHASGCDVVFLEMGATRILECWEEDVPDGKLTDFRRAVQAKEDEAVIFSWIEWPDKETRDKAYATLMSEDYDDPRMDMEKNPMPFDSKRMIWGGFTPVVEVPAP